MSTNLDFFYKLDIYNFSYTDGGGELGNYVVGKSIVDNTERYIANVSINPKNPKELEMFKKFVRVSDSLDGKTIGIDPRLLTDDVIDVLKETYQSGHVLGLRLIPSSSILTKELFDKFNIPEFGGFLIATDNVAEGIDTTNSDLEVVNQEGMFTIEHVTYQDKNLDDTDNYNIHINHELTAEEVKKLVQIVNDGYYEQIFVDFYNPSYYKKLLKMFGEYELDDEVVIRVLGNPLYDELTCYEGLENIIPNEVNIAYTNCRELNEFRSKEPYTEGVNYYSDLESCGFTDIGNYIEMLKLIDEVCDHMDEMGYSPLEKVVYLEDYFKDNFKVDEDYEEDKLVNDREDKIYRKGDLISKGFSGLYSSILRKSGVLCFTYGTDLKSKNIIRVKDEKYGVDNLALIDTIADLDSEQENKFNSFLVPIDNDIYAQTPEVISVPTSLVISTDEYDYSIDNSNPVYSSNPLANAVRMLQMMGFGYGDRKFKDVREETEFYKAALSNSSIIEEIPYDKIAEAVTNVREAEGRYSSEEVKEEDFALTSRDLQTRGNDYYVAPAIKTFGPPAGSKDVELFKVFASDEFDKHFVEMPDQNSTYNKPRKRNNDESIEDYNSYLENYYREEFHNDNKEKEVKRNMEEYVFDTKTVSSVLLYRDANDTGRIYATKDVFKRFGLDTPRYAYRFGVEKLFELKTQDAISILNSANNSIRPYTIEYKYVNVKENPLVEDKASSYDVMETMKRICNPGKMYIKKELADRLKNGFEGRTVTVDGVECYEIPNDSVLYVGNNENKDSKQNENSDVSKLIIYRDVNRPNMLYLRKEAYEKFNLKADVEEVIISGILCCFIDQGDLQYILSQQNNPTNPFVVDYKDVEINTKNMKPVYHEVATDVVKVYRNADDKDKFYIRKEVFDKLHFNTDVEEVIISGVPLYVIDDDDLACIINNAGNKYNPYHIEIADIKLDPKNMKPAKNSRALDEVILYKVVGQENEFYMDKKEFHRFGLKTPVEEVVVEGKEYYLIDKNDLEYIIRRANNKFFPFLIRYENLPVVKEETASDMIENDLIPGTNFKKPRVRGTYESDDEYVAYLEEYYKEIFGIGNQMKK